ncbi:metal cation symporter ZIP14-like isoform X2 [Glandiceps talaboti]
MYRVERRVSIDLSRVLFDVLVRIRVHTPLSRCHCLFLLLVAFEGVQCAESVNGTIAPRALGQTPLNSSDVVTNSRNITSLSTPIPIPEADISALGSDCLGELFEKYGEDGKLSYEGFEKLVFNIGLGKVHPETLNDAKVNNTDEHDEESHGSHSEKDQMEELDESVGYHSDEEDSEEKEMILMHFENVVDEDSFHGVFGDAHSDRHQDNHRDSGHISVCLTPGQLVHVYGVHPWEGLDQSQFIQICPILVQQLDSHSCLQVGDHHGEGGHKMNQPDIFSIPGHIWGYGFLAITIISGVSLVGILTVPLTRRYPTLYKRLLSYLVALAVGSLAGDALLHLIPHSFAGEHEEDEHAGESEQDDHLNMVLKGLVILFGIYFFFIIERIMKYVSHRKQRKKRRRKHWHKHRHMKETMLLSEEDQRVIGAKLERHTDLHNSTQFLDLVTVQGGTGDTKTYVSMNELNSGNDDHNHHDYHKHDHDSDSDDDLDHESASSGGHGHSHNHGNLQNASIASVAWMVIMGDGLHNFSDGLAIGAAFANSLTGGLSTTIAVFCHELPHELGDFAILLTSGMSVKQAVMYSLVSSVLAYIGMFIGIALGNINSMSLWIFAMAGGMFLYIALVDMIPEMTRAASAKNENQCCHLFLQNLGISTGICIMLIIAMFEDDLTKALQ